MEEHLPVRRDEDVSVAQETFTIDEISSLFGLSRDEIQRAVYNGELQARRAGDDIVDIRRADLLDWLDSRGPGV